jgi:hypothetical protein
MNRDCPLVSLCIVNHTTLWKPPHHLRLFTDELEIRLTPAVLTGRGSSVNSPYRGLDGKMYPFIYLVASPGHVHVVAFLLEHDATVDSPTLAEATALLVPSGGNHLTIVRWE